MVKKEKLQLKVKKMNNSEKLKGVADNAEKVLEAVEATSTFFGAVKWLSIAAVAGIVLWGGLTVKNTVYAPFKAAGAALDKTVSVVEGSGEKASDAVSSIYSHNVIKGLDQNKLSSLSIEAVNVLSEYKETESSGFKDKIFRRKFSGSQNKICYTSYNINEYKVDVYAALNNEDFTQSKVLGGYNNAHINLTVDVSGEKTDLNIYYKNDEWKSSFSKIDMSESFSDDLAESVIFNSLESISKNCKN